MDWKKLFSFRKSQEKELNLQEADFSKEALAIVQRNSHGKIMPFYKTDLSSDEADGLAGICIETSEKESEHLVLKLNQELQKVNYQAFICDYDQKEIGIIKGTDQFDILKVQQTNGDNCDIGNENVISKLKDWHGRYPFIIIGADYDWVEMRFQSMPKDKELKGLAKEIEKFCPDIVEQGTGTISGLIQDMKETGKLLLWWD
ncbi:DUF4253 domain-containing protein [Mesobacillus jeotgali]|jgi:hypothetical protein|uniref:DUF4253 domain-containing protein n=1 Tax=Mesobacillus jeotgali TaxID=129985 RepID=A0ABY9VKZ3_9BACI|nr:DUF4253 domain-containing protein [Mesobacillus jeotgali]WNF24627.1 DUF4253 domain-containing protein [Mesobacillus jeotgali]